MIIHFLIHPNIMKSNYTFCFLIILLLAACGKNSHTNLLKINYDKSNKGVWINKTKFPENQDYIKNLDYTILDNPDTHPIHKELLDVFKDVVEGESYIITIPKIQEILSHRDHPELIKIYAGLIEELLIENGEYKVAYENFPKENKELDFNYAYKDFPKTSLNNLHSNTSTLKELKKLKYGQLMIQCKANETIEFAMFDTGADLTTVSRSFAKKAGLFIDENKRFKVNTVTSINIYANSGYIQELQIGNVLIKNLPILVFDDDDVTFQDEDNYLKLDFVLGWNAIRNLKAVLNTKNSTYQTDLSISQPTDFKNFFWCGYPGVKVNSEDGQSLIFGLDTGSSETELKINAKQKIKFKTPLAKDTSLISGFGGSEKYILDVAKNTSLYLASHKITFKELLLRENIDLFFIQQDGTIGAEIFENNIVTLDYKNGLFKIEQ